MNIKSQKKWESYLKKNEIEWQQLYTIPYKVCRDTIIQSFQYKIFHRFFPCNYTLSIWYKDQEKYCQICKEVDYPEHYFFCCKETTLFWKSIQTWLKSVLKVHLNLTVNEIMLGIPNPCDDEIIDIFNYCILYGKWYIYSCKKDDTQMFILNYIKYIKDKLQIEKTICEMKKEDIFEKRWSLFYNSM